MLRFELAHDWQRTRSGPKTRRPQTVDYETAYLRHIREHLPTLYEQLKQEGRLEEAAKEAVEGMRRAEQNYLRSGMNKCEAYWKARREYIYPPSEQEMREEEGRMRRLEEDAFEQAAWQLAIQNFRVLRQEPHLTEMLLPDHRRLVRIGRIELIWPASEPAPE